MNVDIRRTDVELLERLSDAAMRAGHTQTAIEGYSWALRLRSALGEWRELSVQWDENGSASLHYADTRDG